MGENVKNESPQYRKKIIKNQIGKWRVDVIDGKDEVLGSISFNVNSINSAF